MKTLDFLKVLKKIIREEVRSAVKAEMGVLLENVKQKPMQSVPMKKPLVKTPRTTPLVTLEEDFRPVGMPSMASTGNNMLDSLLNETAHDMANPDSFDPELPYSSQDTAMFVKDYSAILKRAEELR